MSKLLVGASQIDISPKSTQFLCGYPHVERFSEGIHDPLLSSAMYISNGVNEVLFIANDIIYLSKQSVQRIRRRISQETDMVSGNIMITATHTHSGPLTFSNPMSKNNPHIHQPDPQYVEFVEERIASVAIEAWHNQKPASIGLAVADATGIGTNRRSPEGAADLQVPVLVAKDKESNEFIACMNVCCMHPTVMHEDSKLVSGDFPGMARIYLQNELFGKSCAILHHTGPAGNQSPRHVTKANTFEEAKRIGEILGRAVLKAVESIKFIDEMDIEVFSSNIYPPRRILPTIEQAQDKLNKAVSKFKYLKESDAPRQQTRTAECDVFGAEKTLLLAQAKEEGLVDETCESVLPAEIQLLKLGDWKFVGWPGEVFIEYALEVKKQCKNTFVIAYANGTLSGYIVTREAAEEGGYEASNTLFSYETGKMYVETTLDLVNKIAN